MLRTQTRTIPFSQSCSSLDKIGKGQRELKKSKSFKAPEEMASFKDKRNFFESLGQDSEPSPKGQSGSLSKPISPIKEQGLRKHPSASQTQSLPSTPQPKSFANQTASVPSTPQPKPSINHHSTPQPTPFKTASLPSTPQPKPSTTLGPKAEQMQSSLRSSSVPNPAPRKLKDRLLRKKNRPSSPSILNIERGTVQQKVASLSAMSAFDQVEEVCKKLNTLADEELAPREPLAPRPQTAPTSSVRQDHRLMTPSRLRKSSKGKKGTRKGDPFDDLKNSSEPSTPKRLRKSEAKKRDKSEETTDIPPSLAKQIPFVRQRSRSLSYEAPPARLVEILAQNPRRMRGRTRSSDKLEPLHERLVKKRAERNKRRFSVPPALKRADKEQKKNVVKLKNIRNALRLIIDGSFRILGHLPDSEVSISEGLSERTDMLIKEYSCLSDTNSRHSSSHLIAVAQVVNCVCKGIVPLLNILTSTIYEALQIYVIPALDVFKSRMSSSDASHSAVMKELDRNISHLVDSLKEQEQKPALPSSEATRKIEMSFRKRFELRGSKESPLIRQDVTLAETTHKSEGSLYLSQTFLCFYSKVFTHETCLRIPTSSLISFSLDPALFSLKIKTKNAKEYTFVNVLNLKSVGKVINLMIRLGQTEQPEQVQIHDLPKKLDNSSSLLSVDSQMLVEGAQLKTYQKNDFIIKEGAPFTGIFQIAKGSVRIEKAGKILAQLGKGEIIGDIAFLERGNSTADVVADSSQVDAYLLTDIFLQEKFLESEDRKGRFYRYVAGTLANRLHNSSSQLAQLPDQVVDSKQILQKAFDLDPKQSILKEEKSIWMDKQGTLYLSPNYLCFKGKVFADLKSSWDLSRIEKAVPRGPVLEIIGYSESISEKFTFPVGSASCQEWQQKISTIVESLKSTITPSSPLRTDIQSPEWPKEKAAGSGIFDDQEDDELFNTSLQGVELFQKDKRVVKQQHKKVPFLFHIRKGSVRFQKHTAILMRILPGEIFGETFFLLGGGSDVEVVADEDSEIALYEVETLSQVLHDNPSFTVRFFQLLCRLLAGRLRRCSAQLAYGNVEKLVDMELVSRVKDAREGVTIKDRKHRLRTYLKCFVGRELVDWLIEKEYATTREEAVSIGRRLFGEGVLRHITRSQPFEDELHLYQFVEHAHKHSCKSESKMEGFLELKIHGKWKICWVLVDEKSLRVLKSKPKDDCDSSKIIEYIDVPLLDLVSFSLYGNDPSESRFYLGVQDDEHFLDCRTEEPAQMIRWVIAIDEAAGGRDAEWLKEMNSEQEEWNSFNRSDLGLEWNEPPSSLNQTMLDTKCLKQGFNLEFGDPSIPPDDNWGDDIDFVIEEEDRNFPYYKEHFVDNKPPHRNYLASVNTRQFFCITVAELNVDDTFARCIFRSKRKDTVRLSIPRHSHILIPPEMILSMVVSRLEMADPLEWHLLPESAIPLLVSFEEKTTPSKNYKFGVIYAKPNQLSLSEDEILANKTSPVFEEFLQCLGENIELNGWSKFAAGLDVKKDSTGTHSWFSVHKDSNVMFHVATCLPYFEMDVQQVERKRHIGNDIVVIVFKEDPEELFAPSIMRSQFNHVWMIVSPILDDDGQTEGYTVAFCNKFGVKPYGPQFPQMVFKNREQFHKFFLPKLLNAERASMYAPDFRDKMAIVRMTCLKELSYLTPSTSKSKRRSVGLFKESWKSGSWRQ